MTPQPEPPPPAEGALAASPPAASAAAPPVGPPHKPMADLPEGEGPQWAAWQALLGFFAAYLGTATAVLIVSLAALPAGVNLDDPPPVFNIVGVLVQDVVFIVAAIAFAAISARPRRWHFGLRRTRFGRTLGWAAIGLVAYIAFTIAYQALVDPQGRQSIADALGVKRGAALLVIGGFVVIVMAPIAEEFFFRGFFYRAMRNSLGRVAGRRAGILLGAVLTGAIFGVMHLEPDRMRETLPLIPLLVVLGVVFCLVYERTRSLFAVIGLHAIVNMFGYLLIAKNSWVVALGFGGAMVIGCMVLPRFLPRPPTATATA